ncbi:MAG TPA: hypothetical protein VK689_23570 [Armatimonadota bacterium]|nr:hypothetical protein [Armatimonadota bacterium]
MMRTWLAALVVTLALGNAGYCGPKSGNGNGDKAPHRLDIQKWPVYPGAKITQQVFLTGDQLAAMSQQAPAAERPALSKLAGVTVLAYKLPADSVAKRVIEFYEPRVLKAGYKIMVKDTSDPEEMSAVYTGPEGGILVLHVDNVQEGAREFEIVSVRGDIGGLAALGKLQQKASPPKAAPPAKVATPETAPEPPK